MFVIEVPYFNLDQIYNSGQAPRWIKLRKSKYVIPYRDKALKVEQQKSRLIMSCSEQDFYDIWFEYLDLKTDYFNSNYKLGKLGKKFKIIANRGSGIHILKQDIFEAYILSKIAMNAGYSKAAVAMNHIAEACGIEHKQSMREAGKIIWYEFPTPEMILDNFDKLKRMGKINAWLKKLCEAIINDGFDITQSNDELFRLFGLHEVEIFPLSGIENTLVKNFKCDAEDFADCYLDKIKNKGLVYMYILYHIMNPPERTVLYGVS